MLYYQQAITGWDEFGYGDSDLKSTGQLNTYSSQQCCAISRQLLACVGWDGSGVMLSRKLLEYFNFSGLPILTIQVVIKRMKISHWLSLVCLAVQI